LEPICEQQKADYKPILTGRGGWVLIESGQDVSGEIYRQGYTKFVAYRRLLDGSMKYKIAKRSDLVADFPIGPESSEGSILYELNKLEPGWGGASTIGGSPRRKDGSASRLKPVEVFNLIENILRRQT
jgi:hypothetical protein